MHPLRKRSKQHTRNGCYSCTQTKSRSNVAKATQLFKGPNPGYEAWKKVPVKVPPPSKGARS